MKKKSVMTFHSTHDALSFESLLKNNNLEIKIIPVPREISASCGLAARFNYEKLEEVMEMISDELEFSEAFLKNGDEYEKIK
ncbi:MAG: DUF3343 domain-containing protein [Bacillota bacterium]